MATADAVLNVARAQLGTRETGRNIQKYGATYGSNGVAWCQIFCWWVMQQVPGAAGLLPKSAYTPYVYDWFKDRKQFVTTPRPGDLVYFNWRGPKSRPWPQPEHVGFVEHVNRDGSLTTIEGNTQPGTAGNQSDGGGVWRRTRAAAPYVVGYGRPAYTAAPPKPQERGPLMALSDAEQRELLDTTRTLAGWLAMPTFNPPGTDPASPWSVTPGKAILNTYVGMFYGGSSTGDRSLFDVAAQHAPGSDAGGPVSLSDADVHRIAAAVLDLLSKHPLRPTPGAATPTA